MKRTMGLFAGILLLAAVPTWADEPVVTQYLHHQPGTITGSVVSSSPNSLVIASDEGGQLTYAIDSRSVTPTDMPAGKRVRVQFRLLDSGAYHAQRVTPLEAWEDVNRPAEPMRSENQGSSSSTETMTARDQTYLRQESAPVTTTQEQATTQTSSNESYNSTSGNASGSAGNETNGTTTSEEGRLPTTASSLPLLALIAFAALGFGTALWVRRRLRRA